MFSKILPAIFVGGTVLVQFVTPNVNVGVSSLPVSPVPSESPLDEQPYMAIENKIVIRINSVFFILNLLTFNIVYCQPDHFNKLTLKLRIVQGKSISLHTPQTCKDEFSLNQ